MFSSQDRLDRAYKEAIRIPLTLILNSYYSAIAIEETEVLLMILLIIEMYISTL